MSSAQREKGRLRRWAKGVRAKLETAALSQRVVQHVLAWPTFGAAQHVLIYLAFGGELELGGLLEAAPHKTFYATRTGSDGALTVHPLGAGGELRRHPYGFLQPPPSAPTPPERIDLAFVPGLAFDPQGHRLGYGKGFYDRLLPQLRPGVAIVGVVPEALVVAQLPAERHDRRVTHLATERGLKPVL
ncbi:5-formyltetrahydrofolate cyclo-ligase [Truepera radiovictrix DSM 17093]|uniref:5-formyltetrahydrofolate cyclo-ligase n=1 Tax=Truepera radiovictrix (strain DSM 17093 / CIP 108686 / LMG 22925 / RQ-24) TaxID=649638 RepID=D7CY15_TRURR|nr:5-formyltetrahydrofolate cyclo-ligase [Truepera radiovictrix DSM 17093]